MLMLWQCSVLVLTDVLVVAVAVNDFGSGTMSTGHFVLVDKVSATLIVFKVFEL